MNATFEIRRLLTNKGWRVLEVNYERPYSGFKCVEGGWLVEFDTEYGEHDYYQMFENLNIVRTALMASPGLILGFLAKDVLELVKSLPNKPPNPPRL